MFKDLNRLILGGEIAFNIREFISIPLTNIANF